MERIKKIMDKLDKKTILLMLVLIVLTMAPIVFQGIICNDEVQTRFLRQQGMVELIKDNINNATAKGRTIGGYVDVRGFSFLTNNMYINRFVDVVLILIMFSLFSYFVYKIHGNKAFSCFIGVMAVVCLPVTFEHGAPNAFVAITVIPAMFVIVSFLLFWKYLNTRKRSCLLISMIFYLIGMMQYEFIVTYVLIFYALILKYEYTKENKRWLNLIRETLIPTVTTLGYIIAYFIMQQFNASNYSGNKVGFESIQSSLKIVYVLAKSSMPGYFLFNDKYDYVQQNCLSRFEYKDFLVVIISLIVVLITSIIVMIFKKNIDVTKKWNWKEMLVAAAFIVIPSLPNSISAMYQGTVTESFFTWLPVSIFLYLASVFFVCSFIWNVLKSMNRYVVIIGALVIACFAGQIQSMNYVIANQQQTDFRRLENIENMFNMQMWTQLSGVIIGSEDVYETRNLLAIHDGFWSTYLRTKGVDINIVQDDTSEIKLYLQDDVWFVLTDGKIAIVISPNEVNNYQAIQVGEKMYACANLENAIEDSGYYVYSFDVKGNTVEGVTLDNAINALIAH